MGAGSADAVIGEGEGEAGGAGGAGGVGCADRAGADGAGDGLVAFLGRGLLVTMPGIGSGVPFARGADFFGVSLMDRWLHDDQRPRILPRKDAGP